MTPQESIQARRQMLDKMVAASRRKPAPGETDTLMQEFRELMTAAAPEICSEQSPFSRVASSMQKGGEQGDALARELYSQKSKFEAREWLRDGAASKSKRFFHTYSTRKSVELIEELYAAGAKTVSIAEPDDNTSDVVIVVLPESRAQRYALAQIHQREMAKVWCYEPDVEAQTPNGEHLVFQYT